MTMRIMIVALAAAMPVLASVGHATPYYGTQVNGTCQVGACDYSNPVPFNTSTTQAISINTTLGNGDMFSIVGSAVVYNNFNGGYLPEGIVYQVTYLGDGHGGTSQADTLDVDTYFAVLTDYGFGNFGAGASGYIGSGLGSGSSAEYTGYGNGVSGPSLQGPFTAPGAFNSNYTNSMPSSGGQFDFAIDSVSQFGAGSSIGSYIVYGQDTPLNPVPEPAPLVLLASGMLCLGVLRRRWA